MAINSLNASSHGLSGLVSGINTQEYVEKLLSGTQSKIDKAGQKKSLLQYKQSMYRDVALKLKTLQSSFLSFTSKTNLLSNSFYNTMTTTVKPPVGMSAAFSVSGSSSAQPGTVTMDYIKQLATARTSKTNVKVSGKVEGALDTKVAKELAASYSGPDAVMTIKVGNKSVKVYNAPTVFGGKTPSEVAQILNDQYFRKDDGNGGFTQMVDAEAKFVNNKLQIVAKNSNDYISIQGNQNASSSNAVLSMKMFGEDSTDMSAQGVFAAAIDTDAYLPSFEVNLDGRQQTIRLDLTALKDFTSDDATTAAAGKAKLIQGIDAQLKRFFGNGVQVSETGGTISFVSGSDSQQFKITGDYVVMGALGLKNGISNKLNTNLSLKDLNFGEDLVGNQHTFKINGVEFSYDSSTTLGTVINDINNSKAGVKISYIESEDKFVMQSSETGAGSVDFDITQSQGNLMTVMFGKTSGDVATGYGMIMDMVADTAVTAADVADGGTFTFNVNGTDYQFSVTRNSKEGAYTPASLAKKMNDAFLDSFGRTAEGKQKIEFLENGGVYTIRVNDGETIVKTAAPDKNKNTNLLGFKEGQSSLANSKDITLSQAGITFGTGAKMTLKVGAETIELTNAFLTDSTTLGDIVDKLNAELRIKLNDSATPAEQRPRIEFDEKAGAFRMISMGQTMDLSITGSDDSKGLDRMFGKGLGLSTNQTVDLTKYAVNGVVPDSFFKQTDAGQNAIFSINNSEMERASNSFMVNGLTYTLHGTTVKEIVDLGNGNSEYKYYDPTHIAITRDTEKIVDGVLEYLKMYNETIDYINGLYKSDAAYKEYPPLTAAQRKEMSDKEIENWEAKSKEGLLRNDSYLGKILDSLRKGMYTKPEGSTLAIYDLGISTSFYSNDGNFNAENVDDLRSAIEKNPEFVRQLMASEGGIMDMVNKAITDATKSSFATPGYLTAVAGSSTLDTTSTIAKQIKDINSQLSSLEKRYGNEYNRYWKQFNAMEKMIQSMNGQSQWLSQQFAS